MKFVRLLCSLVLVGAVGVAVAGTSERRAPAFDAAQCNAAALGAPFTGALRVSAVASFGCEDGWAYVWATIGSGEHAVGVTEVVHWDSSTSEWRISSRLKVCRPGVMPEFIYRQGCFSN